jgi:hypothetical protein
MLGTTVVASVERTAVFSAALTTATATNGRHHRERART